MLILCEGQSKGIFAVSVHTGFSSDEVKKAIGQKMELLLLVDQGREVGILGLL
jgi:hypothetical protein